MEILDVLKKHKFMTGLVSAIILFALVFNAGMTVGGYRTCTESGGTMLSDGTCINLSAVGYCKTDEYIYKDDTLGWNTSGLI